MGKQWPGQYTPSFLWHASAKFQHKTSQVFVKGRDAEIPTLELSQALVWVLACWVTAVL